MDDVLALIEEYKGVSCTLSKAIRARDALDCFGPLWRPAHIAASRLAFRRAALERQLVKLDRRNNFGWQSPGIKDLILKGYYP